VPGERGRRAYPLPKKRVSNRRRSFLDSMQESPTCRCTLPWKKRGGKKKKCRRSVEKKNGLGPGANRGGLSRGRSDLAGGGRSSLLKPVSSSAGEWAGSPRGKMSGLKIAFLKRGGFSKGKESQRGVRETSGWASRNIPERRN